MAEILTLGGYQADAALMKSMLMREEEEGFENCSDELLIRFLDGLILYRRGPSDRKQPESQSYSINNNIILKKLRIAFNFNEEAMLETFAKAEFDISKSELTALFRKRGHKHYRDCGDQLLRRFLKGLTISDRPDRQDRQE